jgi:hypothetical protein
LGKLLLKLETRSKTGSGRKLVILYITYLIPGVFIPWLLLQQNQDVSGFEFSFITYLLYSITICFTIINDLDSIIISKSEAELFNILPLTDKMIVDGKMYMMFRYYLFLSIPLLLPGSIYYYSLLKSFPRVLLYLLSGFMMILFISNIITLVYTAALKILNSSRLGSLSLTFQVLLILFLLITYQLLSYGLTHRDSASISNYISFLSLHGLLNIFPQAWYALLPAKYDFDPGIAVILKILLPFFTCHMSYLSVKWYLEANYKPIREKYIYARIIEQPVGRNNRFFLFRIVSDFIGQTYLRNNLERSSYILLSLMYRRDKTVKLSILPMIIIPAALTLFALFTNQLPLPFEPVQFLSKPVFHISILVCVLVVLNTALWGIKITNYPGASWIYEALPVESKKSFRNGIRKFFIIRLLIPVFVFIFIIMMLKIPIHYLFIHIIFLFASANLFNTIYNSLSKGHPFTKENTLSNSLQRLTAIIIPMIFGSILAALMLFVYSNIKTAMIAACIMLLLTYWLNYFLFSRHTKNAV